jgi:hypothetical protein
VGCINRSIVQICPFAAESYLRTPQGEIEHVESDRRRTAPGYDPATTADNTSLVRTRRAVLAREVVTILCLASALVALVDAGGASAGPARGADSRVTVIGDSVADAIAYVPQAKALLRRGIDLRLELAPCRRVAQQSCFYQGASPPNVVDLARSLGSALGRTVIVEVGYNDDTEHYPGDLEAALDALRQAGVKRVLWTTLRAARQPYPALNGIIKAAAARHAELSVVDWNAYSQNHPDWFQEDGLHLVGAGAVALAGLFHRTLVGLGVARVPTIVTRALPNASLGRAYRVQLVARGGLGPYRWSSQTTLPRGLRLTTSGRLSGVPAGGPATVALSFLVVDSSGATATRHLRLRIGR